MKTIRKSAFLLFLIVGMAGTAPQKATAQVSVNFQLFYDNLSPYGYWIDNANYGYVWVPNVSRGFAPYRTNGYWVYTEMGWTWVSNYSWGWAPFHYGRWFYDAYYGWVWVPDTQWGPAWVTWRYCEGYYGWSAIGPGISLEVAFSSGYNVPHNHWVFVRERDFGRRNISNYYVDNSNNVTIINKSRVVNNIQTDRATRGRYNAGPDRGIVQQKSKASITQLNLKERGKPGQSMAGNELQLYKPRVERGGNNGKKPVPAKITSQHDMAPVVERKGILQPKREQKKLQLESSLRQPENNKPKLLQQKKQQLEIQRSVQRNKELQLQERQKEAREQENRELKLQQQKKQEMPMLPKEQRTNELELQRRGKEPVLPQRDPGKQRNEIPMPLQRNIPQAQRQALPLEHGNTTGRLPVLQKPERHNRPVKPAKE